MEDPILRSKKEKRIKIGMWILIIFGFAVVLMTLWQYPKYLKSPFAKYGQQKGLWKSPIQKEAEELLALKERDTDGDGLSDFDELYIYGTSPYLADSDSDGFSDKEEIESGNDPNCPAGENCAKIDERAAVKISPENNLNNFLGGSGGLLDTESITADELRSALRQAGVSDEMLSKIDDNSLIDLYRETLGEMNVGDKEINVNINTANTNSSGFYGSTDLTASQLREILRQNGVDEAILKSVDDDTLMKIFNESVNQRY